jgi:ribosomal-protein-alanine N-acetyltransferase
MRLETKRLIIRPFLPEDEEVAAGFFMDPEFMVWSPDGALTPDAARKRLRSFIALHETHGFSKLAVVEKESARVIGYCGFGLETIEGEPSPELGYRLTSAARGSGYATEAARAVVADAFARLRMPRVLALVMEENAPSRRVLEKLGLTFRRRIPFHGRDVLLHLLEAPK